MEMVGYQLRAPKGVKLSKPPPRKLTPEEIIKERLHNTNFSNGIQELSSLDQSRLFDVNDNDLGGLSEMTSGIPNLTEIHAPSSCNIKDVSIKQRTRAPRIAKLCKPRPLRHRLSSTETELSTAGSRPSKEQTNTFTQEFFSVKSGDEAEDRILSVIERLDNLDHKSTQFFQDILVKYGPQMEKDNPSFMRSCLACVEEFLKRDCADDGVRSVLRNILRLRKQSWCQVQEVSMQSKGDQRSHERLENENLVLQKSDKTEVFQNEEQKVCRATSCDSGYGDQDDIVLWSNEDSFIQDLSENLKEHSVENTQKEVFVDNGSKMVTNQLEERQSDMLSCTSLSKHFSKPDMDEFSADTKWSDVVKKTDDEIKSENFQTEFTKLKGLPKKYNVKANNQTRMGFKEVTDKSGMWTKESDHIIHRLRDNKSYSSDGADQDSWRKTPIPFGFAFPNRMTTVVEEEDTSKADTAYIPPRPKHLICKLPISDGNAKIVVERHPLGPGSDPSMIAQVENSLPKSIYSASGRRTMFRKYNTAVCFEDIDSDDLEELEHIIYNREELLVIANSPLSKKKPKELSYLCKLFPEVCLTKVEKYFSSKDFQRSSEVLSMQKREGGERHHVPNSSKSNPNANPSTVSKISNPNRMYEFGSHRGFPQAGYDRSLNNELENGNSIFGSHSNFTATDFHSLSSAANGPITNLDDRKTNTVQRNGFGRPSY